MEDRDRKFLKNLFINILFLSVGELISRFTQNKNSGRQI